MAVSLFKFSACCAFLVVFFHSETIAKTLPRPQDGPLVSFTGRSRSKRQTCLDGNYTIEGNICCLCAAGQRVVADCTAQSETKCDQCEKGTYNAPSSLKSCQPCTSCAQPSANLQVLQECTPGRDTKCQCKEGYYCETENCKVCQACQTCGSEGIERECSSTSNRVCKSPATDSVNIGGIIAGVVVSLIVIILVAIFAIWRLRGRSPIRRSQTETSPSGTEMERLSGTNDHSSVNLRPHVPDIAEILGWTTMQTLALKCDIPKSTIENCKLNHPGDAHEQTCELLQKWVEKEGRKGPNKLIDILREIGKTSSAEKILDLYQRNSDA